MKMMHLSIVLLVAACTSVIAQDIKAVKNNWSSEESDSAEDEKATPAPILKANPPPPIRPASLVKPMTKDIKFPMTKDIKFPMTKDIKTVMSEVKSKPQVNLFSSTSGSSETFESFESFESLENLEEIKVKEGSIIVDPKPLTKEEVAEIQSSGPGSIDTANSAAIQRGAPIKVPFIPKSGPKVEVGTVLKPGGFNGRKPVQRPQQVKSIPYESWAESPLSMAPKQPKKNATSEPET